MSGGLPPATAVASTVGSWSPAGLYLTVTFGNFSLNPSSTAWKFFCSSPVQTPANEMSPETLASGAAAAVDPAGALVAAGAAALVAPLVVESLPPPHAATTSATAATASAGRWNRDRVIRCSSSGVIDAEARLGIEEMQGTGVDQQLDVLALLGLGTAVDPG